MADSGKPQDPNLVDKGGNDEIEIIELDDRLDMSLDPFALLNLATVMPDSNAVNIDCCNC